MRAFAPPIRETFESAGGPRAPAAPATASVLHAALLAAAFVIFAHRLALPIGWLCGAAAAAIGSLGAERMIARRYRVPVVLAVALFAVASSSLLVRAVTGVPSIARALAPVPALHLAEALRWAGFAFAGSIAVRGAALRYRAALAVEGSVAVLAVAAIVAAHRDGMIARPLEISDWFWTQGIDPVIAFLAVGLVGGLLLASVLAYGRSAWRTSLQLLVVLLAGVFLASRIHGRDLDEPKRDVVGQPLEGKDDQQGGGSAAKKEGDAQRDRSGALHDDLPRAGEEAKNRPSAVVIFHKDVAPATGIFYFRHGAFSQFNGFRLVESTLAGVDEHGRHHMPANRRRFEGVHAEARARELVATDVALITEHSRMFALSDAVEVGPMPNPEPARFRRAYHVVSSVLTQPLDELLGARAGDPEWTDEIWEHYTELPRDDRYHELAAKLRSKLREEYASDPMAQAFAIKRYLEETATYSFKKQYEGSDPTGEFLFSEEKLGYCVHIAHAAAYLMRAMGLPARVSAGYAVPAQNLAGGSALLIKGQDAHAWAEVFLADVGWVPIEVTPEKTDIVPRPFDEKDLQQLLGEMARGEARFSPEPFQGPRLKDALDRLLSALPWIFFGLVLFAYLTKAWRLLSPVWRPGRSRPAYRAALDRLSAVGWARARGEPPERFAERVANLAPSFEPLARVQVATALGSRDPLGAALGDRPSTLALRVGSELRRRAPWWRWLAGLLNPISWMWSR